MTAIFTDTYMSFHSKLQQYLLFNLKPRVSALRRQQTCKTKSTCRFNGGTYFLRQLIPSSFLLFSENPKLGIHSGLDAMKIAVEGCMHGDLDNVYKTLKYYERVHDTKIDLLLCCGDFQVFIPLLHFQALILWFLKASEFTNGGSNIVVY